MIAEPLDLARIVTLDEFEPYAAASMDPAAYDYIAGGAWDEVSLAENVAAWRRRRLRPRVLVDVSRVDPSTTMLGTPAAFPVAIAPMAFHGLANAAAESASARAAAAASIPFALSTMSTQSIEDVGRAAANGVRWFQLYTQTDPDRSRALVERAVDAGYGAIVVTVDLPILGYRERDLRSGFVLPAAGNFAADSGGPSHDLDLGPSLTWADLAAIRSWSSLPLVLKGIMTAEDARLACEHGADGIIVSNHGARQLDRVAAPVDVLEEVVGAVAGGTEVWVDGGVRRGLDIAIALALGARGVLIGRPILWALAAGGQAGVERALTILREEFEVAMALLGARTPAEIGREHLAP
jgi:4-hydroxymandelate oxidase